jgi:circadian clock protein KaiC
VTEHGDALLQSLVHGVIVLEQSAILFGAERRRLRINKLREVRFSGGYHDMTIEHDGVNVFPRLVAAEHHVEFTRDVVSSGLPQIDALLGGGLHRGTATLILGPAGTAKSVLGTQFASTSAAAGDRVAMFTFDESSETLLARAEGLGSPLPQQVKAGLVKVQQIDPAELSPGEFVHAVRQAVERDGARMILIDSLNGYLHAMPQEEYLPAQLHELLAYLRQRGVVTIMIVAQQGMLGHGAPIDISYLADNVILTRFFEAEGRLRKAISVLKRRTGKHEDTIREISLGSSGVAVSEPLVKFRGVITGVPEIVGMRS